MDTQVAATLPRRPWSGCWFHILPQPPRSNWRKSAGPLEIFRQTLELLYDFPGRRWHTLSRGWETSDGLPRGWCSGRLPSGRRTGRAGRVHPGAQGHWVSPTTPLCRRSRPSVISQTATDTLTPEDIMRTRTRQAMRRSMRFPKATFATGLVATCGGLARRPQMVKRLGCALLLVCGLLYGASQVAAYPPGPSAIDYPCHPPVELPEVR